MAQSLVEVFQGLGQAPRVFRRACEHEVLSIAPTRINDLFRGNSVTGKMMSAYVKLVGTEYAQLVLRPILTPLLQLADALELDTNRMKMTGDLKKDLLTLRTNMSTLQRLTRDILQALFLSIDAMPKTFRSICRELQLTVTHHLADKLQIVPTSLLFLRYICPVVVSPQSYGIFSEAPPPHVSRSLVLLSKVLQALASGVQFGAKESYMTDMNPFLTDAHSMVAAYFERVMTSTGPRIPRRSVIIKTIVGSNDEESVTIQDVITNLDLTNLPWAPHLYHLMSFCNEYLLQMGAALHILPPVPSSEQSHDFVG